MYFLDPHFLLQTLGLIGVFAIIFAESGILLGVIMPGDSLVFIAGVFAANGFFPFTILVVGSILAAVLGDTLGYWVGRTAGPKLFARDESFFFKKRYVEKTRRFYETHGKKTIVLARFVPVVRTLAPFFAGMGDMKYAVFFIWNVLGSVLWIVLFAGAGYFLNTLFPGSERFLTLITFGIVFLSLIPALYEFVIARRK